MGWGGRRGFGGRRVVYGGGGYYGGGWNNGWGWNTRYRHGYYGYQPVYNPLAGFCIVCIFIIIIISAIGNSTTTADCTTTNFGSQVGAYSCAASPNNSYRCWTSLYWNDLTDCEKVTWSCFDYTQSIWDSGVNPAKSSLTWDDLASQTCSVNGLNLQGWVMTLGYTADSWNASNGDPWASGGYGYYFLGIFGVGVFLCAVAICIKIASDKSNTPTTTTTTTTAAAGTIQAVAAPIPNLPTATMAAGGLGAQPVAYPAQGMAYPTAQPIMNNQYAAAQYAQPAVVAQPYAQPMAYPGQPGMMQQQQPGMMMQQQQPGMMATAAVAVPVPATNFQKF